MSEDDQPARVWAHTVDHRGERAGTRRALVNRSFWLHNTPRLIPICRLLGHRPVVDGVDLRPVHRSNGVTAGGRVRWACCDRCGLRLLQPVDPDLEIGQPYTDPLPPPPRALGVIGGQLVLGRSHDSVSAEVKVGNAGSEHTLAAHLHLHRLGALYLHTSGHGTWLQRRLNPTGYESRVIGLSAHHGRLHWEAWAKRNESSSTDPWWMRGSVPIDPRDIIWGPRRYSHTDVGEPETATVRMPHGDDHTVTLQLQRQALGRARSNRRKLAWTVEWSTTPGIPTRETERGRIQGSSVLVSDEAVQAGAWVEAAVAAIATQMTRDRARWGYRGATA